MKLKELGSSNSILNPQLMELESVNSTSATEPHKKCSNALAAAIPEKGRMHLQKCNLKIGNALEKVQSQHRDSATYPERRSCERRTLTISRKGPRRLRRRSCLRGSVNSGIVYVPDSHPTPSASLSGFGVLFWSVLVGLVLRLRGAAPCFVACVRNACITTDGGRWPRQPPPPLG